MVYLTLNMHFIGFISSHFYLLKSPLKFNVASFPLPHFFISFIPFTSTSHSFIFPLQIEQTHFCASDGTFPCKQLLAYTHENYYEMAKILHKGIPTNNHFNIQK
jgi:hypothetical protein